ncbi:MAG: hypothetical protein ACKOVB_03405 [Terrabacter sp.]
MPARRRFSHAAHSRTRPFAATAVAPVAVFVLAACGSATYEDPGARATADVRALTIQPVAPDGALECPPSRKEAQGTTVPEEPQGVDGAARLLPQRAPVSLVVCGYPVMDVTAAAPLTAPFPLKKRTVATAEQRTAVVEAMTWAPRFNGRPRACTAMAGNETAYLVGAAYGDAIVWVAAKADANACATATNGDFVSGAPLGILLDETFGTQRRPTVADESCRVRSWGRLGDDRLLAPDGGPTVVVCRQGADGQAHATALDASRSAQVVAALRALTTKPMGQTCHGSGEASDSRFSPCSGMPRGRACR